MEINIERKTLSLNKSSINHNISKWIEQDIIVPDTKPDAVKIVNITVTPYVTDMEVMDGKIKVVGKLNYFIIYRVSDEIFTTRGLFATYPYTEVLEASDIKKGMSLNIIPITKNLIYSLPNERKIAVKTEVLFKTRAKNKVNVNLINKFNEESKIECKMCKGDFRNIINFKKSIIASKEDIMLPKEAEDFVEILKVDTEIKNTEFKESYNKIMIKGDIMVKMIYLSDNPDEQVKTINTTVPFSAMVELDGINDNSKFEIEYIMQDFNIRQNSDITTSKTLKIEFQIEVNVNMFEEENVEYVEDFYSQVGELVYENNAIDLVKQNIILNKIIDIKENLSNIFDSDTVILDYNIDINNLNVEANNKDIKIDGTAKLNIITQNRQSMELDSKALDILVNQVVNVDEINAERKTVVSLKTDNLAINQNGSDIEVKLNLIAVVEIEDLTSINVIDDIKEEKLDTTNLDSMNIYIVKAGDTLWSIAKRYKTSVEKIVITNDILDPNVIDVGQKIFIIR